MVQRVCHTACCMNNTYIVTWQIVIRIYRSFSSDLRVTIFTKTKWHLSPRSIEKQSLSEWCGNCKHYHYDKHFPILRSPCSHKNITGSADRVTWQSLALKKCNCIDELVCYFEQYLTNAAIWSYNVYRLLYAAVVSSFIFRRGAPFFYYGRVAS